MAAAVTLNFITDSAGTSGVTLGSPLPEVNVRFAPAPLPTITVADATVTGETGTADFVVTLSASPGQEVTLDYTTREDGSTNAASQAVAGYDPTSVTVQVHDYIAATGSLTFAAATTALSQTIAVTIISDAHVEFDETFGLRLSNLAAGAATFSGGGSTLDATGTITARDIATARLMADENNLVVPEGSPALFRVTVRPTPIVDITVGVEFEFTPAALRPSTQATTVSVVFAAGTGLSGSSAQAILTVDTAAVPMNDPSTIVLARLADAGANYMNGSPVQSRVTVADAATLLASIHPTMRTVREDAGNITFEVRLNGTPGAARTVAVGYQYRLNTARAPADLGDDFTLTAGTLTFTGNQTSHTITVGIIDDDDLEPDETFGISYFRSAGDVSIVTDFPTITIEDNDRPAVTFSFAARPGGGA